MKEYYEWDNIDWKGIWILATLSSKNNFPIEILKAGVPPRLVLESDDMSLNMVDRLGDEVILHFDSEYEPTETGRIIESLIDKING